MLGLLFGTCGCDRPTAATGKPTVAAGRCRVHGVVRFSGPKPAEKVIGGNCCPGTRPVPDESVVVNANGTLRNAVVYVKDGPNVATDEPNVVLTQNGCRYVPHVLAVRTGQTIAVTSHDDTLHNVHVESATNPGQNFSEQLGGSHAVTFAHPDGDVLFKCDVHAWMSAHVAVFDHPFFAVTGDDGGFDLPKLPPGSYTLVLWHETFGTVERPFTVSPEKPVATTDVTLQR